MGDTQLNAPAQALMADVRNVLFLSTASLWEMGIKTSIGKLTLPGPFGSVVRPCLTTANIQVLAIKLEHVEAVASLPFHHKDPFDRMLAVQCLVEGMPVLSADTIFDQYGI